MGIIIGIDVGISTTKIVGIRGSEVLSPIRIKATDPVTSLYGAFGKFLFENHIALPDIERVMLTGVGSAYIDGPVYGLPTHMVDEFVADGLGARFEMQLERMIVVSMGTGTSIVKCDGHDIRQVAELAQKGNVANINLLISDICAQPLPGLPMDAIASLCGKAQSNASREDVAIGLIWMVLQSVCSASILSSLESGIKDFVMIGNLTLLPQCPEVFRATGDLYGVRFHVPRHAEFCTAIGTAIAPAK